MLEEIIVGVANGVLGGIAIGGGVVMLVLALTFTGFAVSDWIAKRRRLVRYGYRRSFWRK